MPRQAARRCRTGVSLVAYVREMSNASGTLILAPRRRHHHRTHAHGHSQRIPLLRSSAVVCVPTIRCTLRQLGVDLPWSPKIWEPGLTEGTIFASCPFNFQPPSVQLSRLHATVSFSCLIYHHLLPASLKLLASQVQSPLAVACACSCEDLHRHTLVRTITYNRAEFHLLAGPHDVRVKIKAAGICGSDLHVVQV